MKWLKVVLVNLLILFIFLAGWEACLRVFWKMNGIKKSIYRTSKDPLLRYELVPNTSAMYDGYQVDINSDGFRGPEILVAKPKGTYRVVVIGDSGTFGVYSDYEISIAPQLQQKLQAMCPGKKFEVLNMGVQGYNTLQEYEMLKVKGLKYNPDLVIVYYGMNDTSCPEYYFEKNFFNANFYVARYIQHFYKKYLIKYERKKHGVQDEAQYAQYLYSGPAWEHVRKLLLEMGDLTQKAGAPMVLLIYPEKTEFVKNYREGFPFWNIYEKIESVRHPNIISVSPVREYSRLNVDKDKLRIGTYPNLTATTIILDYMIQELGKKGIYFCNTVSDKR